LAWASPSRVDTPAITRSQHKHHLESAGKREAIDGGDHREREALDAGEQRKQPFQKGRHSALIASDRLLEIFEVGAGAEGASGAPEHHCSEIIMLLALLECAIERRDHVGVDGVHGRRPLKGDEGGRFAKLGQDARFRRRSSYGGSSTFGPVGRR
jgi:hypothetical protein